MQLISTNWSTLNRVHKIVQNAPCWVQRKKNEIQCLLVLVSIFDLHDFFFWMSCNKKGHNVCSGSFSYHKLLRLTLDSSSKYSLHKFFPVQLFRDHYVEYFEWEKRTKEKHYDLSNQSFFSNQSRIIWWGWHGKYRLSCIALVISILWGEKWK